MKRKTNRKGFSIIELVLGVAAGSAIALVAYFLIMPAESWVFTHARRAGVSNCSAAMSRMLKEIRLISGPAQIVTFTADHLQFVDIDSNTVNFQQVGTDLMRDSDVLTRNVQELVFTYLDADGNVTAVKEDVRVIRVKLAIISGTQTVILESASLIRNP